MKKNNEHPEVADMNNICDVSPHSKTTKEVCGKIRHEKTAGATLKKSKLRK